MGVKPEVWPQVGVGEGSAARVAWRRRGGGGTSKLFKAAELYRMTLFNGGFFVKIDSLTPTRGAGVRGVGGGGPGWGLDVCYELVQYSIPYDDSY